MQVARGDVILVNLDQLRTVDRGRVVRVLGRIPGPTMAKVLDTLREMFAP